MKTPIVHPITGLIAVTYCSNCDQDRTFHLERLGDDVVICNVCQEEIAINACDWEMCFSKWGQLDGDGILYTFDVAEHLTGLGYAVEVDRYGLHNTVIQRITDEDGNVLSDEDSIFEEDIREKLPANLVKELDDHFKPNTHAWSPITWVDQSSLDTAKASYLVISGTAYQVQADSPEAATAKCASFIADLSCLCDEIDCECVEEIEARTEVISWTSS